MRPTSRSRHVVHIGLWTRGLVILIAGCLSLAGSAAGATPFLYVGNYAGEVQVVDTATNAVVGTIPTSNGSGLVLHPDGSRLYVVDASSTIKVYDTGSNALVQTIPGPVDGGIAISPTGDKLYIASYSNSFVRVVDTSTYADVATIPSPQATTVAVSPDGTRVYVTDQNTRVYVLDATTNTPLTYVPVGNFVTGLAVHPSGTFLYAANTNDDTVSVVDTATNSVVATVPVGPPGCCYFGPTGLAVHPAGTFVYGVTADMTLRVIRTSDNVLVASIPTPPNAPGADGTTFLKTSPDGNTLYFSKYSGGTVTAVATSTNTVTAIIPISGVPGMLAMPNPDVDGDGVENSIDTGAGSFADSNNPPTTGHIVSTNGLTVTVQDSLDPTEGVVITVGAGVGAARVSVCGFSLQVSAGSSIVVTCGSITLKVNEGVARVLLNAAETSYVEVTQDAIAKVELQATDGTFAVQNLGETPIAVATNSVITPVAPGEHASAGMQFTGFYSPIEMNDVQNRVKAGSTVPLKWRLTNAIDGSPVTDLSSASATVSNLACGLVVTDDLIEETSAGGVGLQNLGDGYYQFNWKTPKTYGNSCKTLTLTLGGGIVPTQSALFSFVK